MDQLKNYVEIVKKNIETMNASDYYGKEDDLKRQEEEIEKYERWLKQESVSGDQFDQIVDAAVDCAAGDISFSQLEDVYRKGKS
ncbi:YnfE family protein [Bacillus sp. CLL-7-23]|uniref:YnfE family protein n=1 Tax=Bacillus changyiensis TaxID=3004103 RepID=A0ABT4X6W2_9BACI|nr:YnfE family protein [Bacillus changyiensis]MDA7027837.1 YnfE family protein [Bacillus changyiensis]